MELASDRRRLLVNSLSRNGFHAFELDELEYDGLSYLSSDLYRDDQIIVKGEVKVPFENKELSFECIIRFPDLLLTSLPSIYLITPVPVELKLPVPHIWPYPLKFKNKQLYHVCIVLADSITIDRFDPDLVVRFVVGQLVTTFSSVIDLELLQDELQKDIFPLWIALAKSQPSKIVTMKFGMLPTKEKPSIPFKVLTNGDDSKPKNITLNGGLFYIPDSAKVPQMNGHFTADFTKILLQDFLDWIKKWYAPAHKNILESLKKYREFDLPFFAGFLFCKQIFYVSVKFDQIHINRISAGLNLSVVKFKGQQDLGFGVGDIIQLERTVTRNLTNLAREHRSLHVKQKRILQIGCGAIGGYLADALVKIGGGIGEGAELHLLDHDTLEVDNLGRHFLSATYLGKYKTKALELHLNTAYELFLVNEKLHISTTESSITTQAQEFIQSFDLIVDATGKSEVAQFLNEAIRVLSLEDQVPILHLWIYANGECVQGLWSDPAVIEQMGGCYHCLTSAWRKDPDHFIPIEGFDLEQTVIVEQPCSAFTPYAVSASMNVASLAIELLLSLQNETLVGNYFTRYSAGFIPAHLAPAMTLIAQPSCPFCSGKLA